MEYQCRWNSPVSRFLNEGEPKPFRGGVYNRVQYKPGTSPDDRIGFRGLGTIRPRGDSEREESEPVNELDDIVQLDYSITSSTSSFNFSRTCPRRTDPSPVRV